MCSDGILDRALVYHFSFPQNPHVNTSKEQSISRYRHTSLSAEVLFPNLGVDFTQAGWNAKGCLNPHMPPEAKHSK